MTPEKSKDIFVHESSYLDEGACVGAGTKIWHFSHIQAGAHIGEDCVLGQNVNVANKAIVGNNCKIQNNVSIYDGVTLEDDVFCGPSCVFTNDFYPRAHSDVDWAVRPTLVKHGASIGANATIVCGSTIGSYALIGSGAVVTHDVPAHALMAGVPAHRIGWVCSCGSRLDHALLCPVCGAGYVETEGVLSPL
jgi:UDP-2-acetamido-3-amino-2,3-dideoxy-glucuronate N-acetyltransferase